MDQTHQTQIELLRTLLPGPLADTLAITIPFYRFHRRMFSGMVEALTAKHGIGNSEVDVMVVLYAAPEQTLSPTQLYQRLLFSSGGMTKVLKKLEERGCIDRIENPSDRRSKLVRLNAEGRTLIAEALGTALAFERDCLSNLDAHERGQFKALLEKLLLT